MDSIKRNSSFELLRIISTIMIISLHYSFWGGYEKQTQDTLTCGAVYVQFLQMFGRVACSEFVMISGYYLIHSTKSNYYKKIAGIVLEMLFYSFTISVFVVLIGYKDNVIWYRSLFPFIFDNWFACFYIVFLLILPDLNKMLAALDEKEFKRLIIIMIVTWSIIPTLTLNYWQFSNVDFFVVTYCLGAYLGKFGIHDSKRNCIIMAILLAMLMLLSVVGFDLLAVITKNDKFINHSVDFKEFNNIVALLFSISFFKCFIFLNFNNSLVNTVAKYSLGIYLISDNYLMRSLIWEEIYPNKEYINNPFGHSFLKISAVFIICLFVDYLRSNYIANRVDKKIIERMLNLIKKVELK